MSPIRVFIHERLHWAGQPSGSFLPKTRPDSTSLPTPTPAPVTPAGPLHSLPKSRGVRLAAGWKSQILQFWSCLTWVPCFVFLGGRGVMGWDGGVGNKWAEAWTRLWFRYYLIHPTVALDPGIFQTRRRPQSWGLPPSSSCFCFNCLENVD